MFKKQVLVLAMLAVSGAAFADNEAEISQDATAVASLATIEQNTLGNNAVTGQLTGSYGQIIQSATNSSSGQIYQGSDPANDTAVLDTAAGTPVSQSIMAQTVTLPVDGLAYVSQTGVLAGLNNSVAVIGQYNTVNAQASILQLTGAEDTSFAQGTVYLAGIGNTAGNATSGSVSTGNTPIGITAAPATVVTYAAGANTYTDSFLGTNILGIGTGVGGAVNNGNLGVVAQGATPNDRAGTALDAAANTWGAGGIASYDDQAQIIQTGLNQTATIIQAGDAQLASIYQDGQANDAYIVQFGQPAIAQSANDTTADPLSNFAAVVQLAASDVATIEQGGTQNTAYILQH